MIMPIFDNKGSKAFLKKKISPKDKTEAGRSRREVILQEIIVENPAIKRVVTIDTEGKPLLKNPEAPAKKAK